jgi:hypothetical protein
MQNSFVKKRLQAGKIYNTELLCEEAVTSRKDFTMLNSIVKKRLQAGKMLQCRIAL